MKPLSAAQYGDIVRSIAHEFPGALAVVAVEVATGIPLAISPKPAMDPVPVAARQAEVIREKQRALYAQHHVAQTPREVMVSAGHYYYSLAIAPAGDVFLMLAADARQSNPVAARALLQRYFL